MDASTAQIYYKDGSTQDAMGMSHTKYTELITLSNDQKKVETVLFLN